MRWKRSFMFLAAFEDAVKLCKQTPPPPPPPFPFGILIRSTLQRMLKIIKKYLHTEAALNVWFYTLLISADLLARNSRAGHRYRNRTFPSWHPVVHL